MTYLKKFLKYTSLVVILIIVIFGLGANFFITETKYQCTGKIDTDEISVSTNLFMLHTEYHLSGEGTIHLEFPDERVVEYYPYLKDIEHLIYIYDQEDDIVEIGSFYNLSKNLSLMTSLGRFRGTCKQIKD